MGTRLLLYAESSRPLWKETAHRITGCRKLPQTDKQINPREFPAASANQGVTIGNVPAALSNRLKKRARSTMLPLVFNSSPSSRCLSLTPPVIIFRNGCLVIVRVALDRKSTRLNSSHLG